MTLLTATNSIYGRWATEWGSTTAYVFEDESAEGLAKGKAPWCRVIVAVPGGGQQTLGPIGARKYDRRGVVFVQIHTLTEAGVATSRTLADQARNVLEGEAFDGLAFDDATIDNDGIDGRWKRTVVQAFFHYQEHK